MLVGFHLSNNLCLAAFKETQRAATYEAARIAKIDIVQLVSGKLYLFHSELPLTFSRAYCSCSTIPLWRRANYERLQ
jgi:hypothetical protein